MASGRLRGRRRIDGRDEDPIPAKLIARLHARIVYPRYLYLALGCTVASLNGCRWLQSPEADIGVGLGQPATGLVAAHVVGTHVVLVLDPWNPRVVSVRGPVGRH